MNRRRRMWVVGATIVVTQSAVGLLSMNLIWIGDVALGLLLIIWGLVQSRLLWAYAHRPARRAT